MSPTPSSPSSLPPPPSMKKVKATLLTDNSNSYINLVPNARNPTEFETEFFKGKVLLLLRTNPIDKYYEHIFQDKRAFEVQVQGCFKRLPGGELFVGAESEGKMGGGFLTKSLANAAMKFASTIVNNVHYSFGDSNLTNIFESNDPKFKEIQEKSVSHKEKKGKNFPELAHTVAPLLSTLDRVIVSKPHEKLPEMGKLFHEDPVSIKRRKKGKGKVDEISEEIENIDLASINLENIYSFSINSANIDLYNWQVIGIPMMKSLDLRNFFEVPSINLVSYEANHNIKSLYQKKGLYNRHPSHLLNYLFCIKIEHGEFEHEYSKEANNESNIRVDCGTIDVINSDAEDPSDAEKVMEGTHLFPIESESETEDEEIDEEINEIDEELEADEIDVDHDDHSSSTRSNVNVKMTLKKKFSFFNIRSSVIAEGSSQDIRRTSMRSWLMKPFTRSQSIDQPPDFISGGLSVDHVNESDLTFVQLKKFNLPINSCQFDLVDDLSYCPCTVELLDPLKPKNRRILFLLPSHPFLSIDKYMANLNPLPRLRSRTEINAIFDLIPLKIINSYYSIQNRRLSNIEKYRRQVALSYHYIISLLKSLENNVDTKNDLNKAISPNLFTTSPSIPNQDNFTKLRFDLIRQYNQTSINDVNILHGGQSVATKILKNNKLEYEGVVLLASSRRHFSENYLILSTHTNSISLKMNINSTVQTTINFDSILHYYEIKESLRSIKNMGMFAIETMARVFYFVTYSDKITEEWLRVLHFSLLNYRISSSSSRMISSKLNFNPISSSRKIYSDDDDDDDDDDFSDSFDSLTEISVDETTSPVPQGSSTNFSSFFMSSSSNSVNIDEKEKEKIYICRSPCFRENKKRIYNCRQIFFTDKFYKKKNYSPNYIVEKSLKILKTIINHDYIDKDSINESDQLKESFNQENDSTYFMNMYRGQGMFNDLKEKERDSLFMKENRETCLYCNRPICHYNKDKSWLKFLNLITNLQNISLNSLSEREKISFYLNLYHIMLIHGFLIYGTLKFFNQWSYFFNNICYLVSNEIISIADIDHNILRSNMTRFSLCSTFAMTMPTLQFFLPSFHITSKDFRFHFAINNGSVSQLSFIPIYTPEKLDDQLDCITTAYLKNSYSVDLLKKVVYLPKIPLLDYCQNSSVYSLESSVNSGTSTFGLNDTECNSSTTTKSSDVTIYSTPVKETQNTINPNISAPFTYSSPADINPAHLNQQIYSYSNQRQYTECLNVLLPYLSENSNTSTQTLLKNSTQFWVKFKKLSFKCRYLKIIDESIDEII